MNTRVRALMGAQSGLVTRQQAIELGMSADHVDRLVRTKVWAVVRRGVYAEAALVAALGSERERRLLADRAASMRIASPHVLSHHSAAYRLGLAVLQERPAAMTHVTRPGIVGTHRRHGVSHHRAPYSAEQVVTVEGLRCLDAARTVADIAREQGFLQGLVAADDAMRTGLTRRDLRTAAATMESWPFRTVVDDVVESATADADSVGETLSRELVASLGRGVPEVQFGLTADGRTAWCDLRLGRHVFEFDGRVKYRRVDEGGVATASPEDAVWFEKRRQDFVCGFKLGVSRLVWDDAYAIVVGGPPLVRVQERLRREYDDTCRRFGTDIGDLAAYRPRELRPRPGGHRPRAA